MLERVGKSRNAHSTYGIDERVPPMVRRFTTEEGINIIRQFLLRRL